MKKISILAVFLTVFCFFSNADPTNYLTFVGSSYQYVEIPTTTDLQATSSESLTLSFWVKGTEGRTISNRYRWGNTYGAFDFYTGGFMIISNDGSGPFDQGVSTSATEWSHYVVVLDRSGSSVKLYENGSLYTSNTNLQTTDVINTIAPTYFGTMQNNDGSLLNYLTGSLANVRFYKSALTEEEVEEDMEANSYSELSDELKTSCVAAYDLTDNYTSLTLTDATGRGNDGTLVNYDEPVVVIPDLPTLTNTWVKSNQQNRYLKSVSYDGIQLFEATSEEDLPRVDRDDYSETSTQGALVDKTSTPIEITKGVTSVSLNFKAWTTDMTIGTETAAGELEWTSQAIFIDWDNDGAFNSDSEIYSTSSAVSNTAFESAAGFTTTLSIPEDIEVGEYRMRVIHQEYFDGNSNWSATFFDSDAPNCANGRGFDFIIDVQESTIPERTISVSCDPEGAATLTGAGTSNLPVTVSAVGNAGYVFINWTLDGEEVSTSSSFIDNTGGDKAYVANFSVDYCKVTEQMEALGSSSWWAHRYTTSVSFSDGENELSMTGIQSSSYSVAQDVYIDRTSSVFTTSAGSTISTTVDSSGDWVTSYIYLDYNDDKVFDNSRNDDGTPSYGSEILAYSSHPYDDEGVYLVDHTGELFVKADVSFISGRDMKDFVIPTNVKPGTYRGRFVTVENCIDPCGGDNIVSDRGTMLDFTVVIVSNGVAERIITVESADETMGTVTEGATSTEAVTFTATANSGYYFVNWTVDGVEVSTEATYTDETEGDKTYVANFEAVAALPTLYNSWVNSNQQNRYLKSVTCNAVQLFEATSEDDLPRMDRDDYTETSTQGALVDKTSTPIEVIKGITELTLNFKAWTTSMTIDGATASGELEWTSQAIFIDWDQDGAFNSDSEIYSTSSADSNTAFESTAGFTTTLSIPDGIEVGSYRMRVIHSEYFDGNSNWSATFWDTETPICQNGRGFDFIIDIKESELAERTITLVSDPEEGGVLTGGGTSNLPMTITATANGGYVFVNWTLDGQEVSTDASFTDNSEGDKTYVANFDNEYCIITEQMGSAVASWAHRYTTSLSFSDGENSVTITGLQSSSYNISQDVYFDKLDNTFETKAGRTISTTLDSYGEWVKSYIYLDYNNDMAFDNSRNDDGTPSYGSEILAYSSHPYDDEGLYLVDHTGELYDRSVTYYITGRDMKDFVIPENVQPGTYRGRFVTVEDCIDPCGGDNIVSDRGTMIDFTVIITAPEYTVTTTTRGRGAVTINGVETSEATIAGESTVELVGTPEDGSEFLRWEVMNSETGEIISTSYDATYTIASLEEHMLIEANFGYTDGTRYIMVMSNDPAKGTAAITAPDTEYSSVMTGEDVDLIATPASDDIVFVNWTNYSTLEVLSTETEYTYTGASSAILYANFAALYTVSVNDVEGGSYTLTSNGTSIVSGAAVNEQSTIVIKATAATAKELSSILVNGVEVISEYDETAGYSFTITEETTISVIFSDVLCTLTYSSSGDGYIEVWSSYDNDSYGPAGTQYQSGEAVVYNAPNYIFAFPGDGATLESLTVNGETENNSGDFIEQIEEYDSAEFTTKVAVEIIAVFSGAATGIEDANADAVSVYGVAGGIKVISSTATSVEVYDIAGAKVANEVVSGTSTIEVIEGIYLVKANGKVSKVIVK